MSDPAAMEGMMGMMKGQMTMMIPQTLIMGWINAFFSGFVISKSIFFMSIHGSSKAARSRFPKRSRGQEQPPFSAQLLRISRRLLIRCLDVAWPLALPGSTGAAPSCMRYLLGRSERLDCCLRRHHSCDPTARFVGIL
jgi:hypothetical protein